MHSCEALLAAFEATTEQRYLQRAALLAHNITVRQAALSNNLIWEHYHSDWSVDWDYNRHDKTNIFRPWGYQPGHLTEWAKLLLILERHQSKLEGTSDWLVPRAIELFDAALERAWDHDFGGICYGFAPDGSICDTDKYFWVQAESLAAAALLADRTGAGKVLALVRAHLGLQLAPLRRSSLRRLVSHPHARQPQVQRREKSCRQDRLPHHGRLLRGAQRHRRLSSNR